MDLSDLSPVADTTVYADPFSAAQAQQLLQRAGWTYYTIWRKNVSENPLLFNYDTPGLVWSQGDVNRSLLMPDQNNAYAASRREPDTSTRESSQQLSKALEMGHLLQQFYKCCSFLPPGLGVAGMAMACKRYQWVNNREGIFQQISSLSSYNWQHTPANFQKDFFETVVCIPLKNGAGVLEMGTDAMVPESEGMLQMLGSIEGLVTGIHREREQERFSTATLSSSTSARQIPAQSAYEHGEFVEELTADIPNKATMYSRTGIRRMSRSSSSAVSDSSPSADHLWGISTDPNIFSTAASPIPFMSDEDVRAANTPAATNSAPPYTSLTVPKSTVQLDMIFSQLGYNDLHCTDSDRNTPILAPVFADEQLGPSIAQHLQSGRAAAGQEASYVDDSYSSNPNFFCSKTDVAPVPISLSPLAHQDHQHGTFISQQQHFGLDHGSQQDHQRMITKSAASGSCFSWYSAGSEARDDDQYCTRDMQQEEATDDHYRNDMQLGALKDRDHLTSMHLKSARDWCMNKQQAAGAAGAQDGFTNMRQDQTAGSGDNHHMRMGRYVANVSTSRRGAFRRWHRPPLGAVISRENKARSTARSDSFLKKLLIQYLPRQQGRRKNSVWIEHGMKTGQPEWYVQEEAGSLQQLINVQGVEAAQLVAADDYQSSPSQPDLTAVNHMIAERKRRRKEAECYRALRNLVPDVAKKDKVALLEQSVVYLKQLENRVSELNQEKASLKFRDSENRKRSQADPRCSYTSTPMSKDGEYFDLSVKKLGISHENINLTSINIISALRKKNLHGIKFKSKLEKSTRKVDIEVLAKHIMVGDNCSLSSYGIQEIKEWWPTFVKSIEINTP